MKALLVRARSFIRRKRKFILEAVVGLVVVFVLANGVVFWFYRHRSYPNTTVSNQHLGSVKYDQFPSRLGKLSLLPASLQLTYQNKSATTTPTTLGMHADTAHMAAYAARHRVWLPLANFLWHARIPLVVSVDSPAFQKAFDSLLANFRQDATDARLVLQNGNVMIAKEANGYRLAMMAVQRAIVSSVATGQTRVELPVEVVPPHQKEAALQADRSTIQKQLATPVTFRYQDKTKKMTAAEVSSWYAPSGNSFVLSDSRIQGALVAVGSGFGIRVQNMGDAAMAAKQALLTNKALDFTLVAAPPASKVLTYCTAVRGVDASFLSELASKLAATYSDPRGWSLGGQITYTKADSGCNFTVWLSAASQMPTFGAICDSTWSCTVSPNVVINFDRWQSASSSWNQAGGSLDDYRSMVINHETGHWLGFGHSHCGGPGQLAPVMQQQSIDLEGCAFNAWPLPGELDALRQKQGL